MNFEQFNYVTYFQQKLYMKFLKLTYVRPIITSYGIIHYVSSFNTQRWWVITSVKIRKGIRMEYILTNKSIIVMN